MKKLFIVRHGKAEEPTFDKNDFERNLTEVGSQSSKNNAIKLKDLFGELHDLELISSSANRAIQTAVIFAKVLNYPKESIIQTTEIYEAFHINILQLINKVGPEVDNLFVFGHNPGLSNLIEYLCDEHVELKTANIGILSLDEGTNFSELSEGLASFDDLIH